MRKCQCTNTFLLSIGYRCLGRHQFNKLRFTNIVFSFSFSHSHTLALFLSNSEKITDLVYLPRHPRFPNPIGCVPRRRSRSTSCSCEMAMCPLYLQRNVRAEIIALESRLCLDNTTETFQRYKTEYQRSRYQRTHRFRFLYDRNGSECCPCYRRDCRWHRSVLQQYYDSVNPFAIPYQLKSW